MMCGFSGFIDPSGLSENMMQWMERMLDAISHRGPDDSGIWIDPESGIVLGHRRLAIVDLSPAGHQPMHSVCGRWVIIFNGEIYNHEVLRKEMEESGWKEGWRGHSDTEVLLAAISKFGVMAALEKCVGMFAFALWDRHKRTLTLARDRLGEKPLYYGWLENTFLFASDLAALYRHPQWKGKINRDALALLMRYSYIPAPYSVFSNISKLQPGRVLTLKYGSKDIKIDSYWNASKKIVEIQPFEGTPEQAVNQLENLLKQSIADQMMADVPLGAFLSGGIDSSSIVALMQSLSHRPINTFTIGFHEEGYNEARHAKAVATHLGTNHTELYVSPDDILKVIPQLPSIYSEPFSDSSQIPTFLISRLARHSVTVSLSGDGGDELFSGYSRHMFVDKIWSRLSLAPASLRKILAKGIQSIPVHVWNAISWPILKFAPTKYQYKNVGDKLHKLSGLFSLRTKEEVYQYLISHWQTPGDLVLGAIEPPTMLTGLESSPLLTNFVRQMMYLDTISYLPDDILTKVDRASMAVSLETRVPLLDHRLVEFAMSLPINFLQREGQSKWPLRQILYRYVPRSIIERPKMGFGVPIGNWLRGPLREWGESLLGKDRLDSESYFNSNIVRSIWEQHQSGRGNWQYLLWDVLCFQAWLEHYSSSDIK